ncbi:MAG: transaldolase family protein [Candidatus Krumholzibacteriia bacterium]
MEGDLPEHATTARAGDDRTRAAAPLGGQAGMGRGLRLYLDSADPSTWRRWLATGVFHGITTNPLLLERAGHSCNLDTLSRLTGTALELGAAEVHLQAWGDTAADLARCGRRLRDIAAKVVVKVPVDEAGLVAARELHRDRVPVTLTALHHPHQAVLAAAAGAAYAAPYLGRMSDAGRDGMVAVLSMHEILARTGSCTRLLVASLRSAGQVADLARAGLDTFTVNAAIAEELVSDELTDAAVADFRRASRSSR